MVGNKRWTEDEIETLKELYYDHTNREIAEVLEDRTISAIQHKGPRLGLERSERAIVERKASEYEVPDTDSVYAGFISGLVCGEGSFYVKDETQFVFSIKMADRDEEILREMKEYLSVGRMHLYDGREESWEDTARYEVSDRSEILGVIIPFFNKVGLRNSYKSRQYTEWRREFYRLLDQKT